MRPTVLQNDVHIYVISADRQQFELLENGLKREFFLEMVLTVGNVSDAICYCHNLWDMVLVIFLGGKIYSCIRASGVIIGREIFLT